MTISREVLRAKLDESLATRARLLTRRDVRLPAIPGKAFAVIGVRRSGKTSFLAQCRADRLHRGAPSESQLLLLLEDERLAGLTVADMDTIELNEAFASVAAACSTALDLPEEKTNPNGGAIALGHPVGASGTILTVKAMYELERIDGRYAMVSLCIGGGQGIASIFERIN